MGFTGKLTVHPNQISIVNEFFSPGEVEVDNAIELVSAFAENMREGKMAFLYKGKMVDTPHLERAKKILELSNFRKELLILLLLIDTHFVFSQEVVERCIAGRINNDLLNSILTTQKLQENNHYFICSSPRSHRRGNTF